MFTLASGRLATGVVTTQAVRSALHTAVAAVTTAGTAAASAVLVGFAALLFPSPLANGERRQLSTPLSDLVPDDFHAWSLALSEYQPNELHALSIPLSDLAQGNLDDLYAVAQVDGEVRLPVAIGSRSVGNITEFFVAATNDATIPGNVPVRLATFDPAVNAYRSYNPDAPSIGMTWTPIVKPETASTSLPESKPNIAVYDGTTPTALEGRLDEFPELDLYSFGGFITVSRLNRVSPRFLQCSGIDGTNQVLPVVPDSRFREIGWVRPRLWEARRSPSRLRISFGAGIFRVLELFAEHFGRQ